MFSCLRGSVCARLRSQSASTTLHSAAVPKRAVCTLSAGKHNPGEPWTCDRDDRLSYAKAELRRDYIKQRRYARTKNTTPAITRIPSRGALIARPGHPKAKPTSLSGPSSLFYCIFFPTPHPHPSVKKKKKGRQDAGRVREKWHRSKGQARRTQPQRTAVALEKRRRRTLGPQHPHRMPTLSQKYVW